LTLPIAIPHAETDMDVALTLDSAVVLKATVVIRDTGFGAVLLDVASGGCWELNVIGAAIWNSLATGHPLRAAFDLVAGQYAVARPVLEADVLLLIADLTRNGLLEIRA
jgi:hypothetical protein